jgi:ribosomal protein L7/L12
MSLLGPEYSLLALVAAFLAGVVAGRLTAVVTVARRRTRTREIDRDIDAADTLALLPAETRIEIDTLVADGRKIEAIRVCRAALGLDLKEAKDMIDLVEAMNARGARAPERTEPRGDRNALDERLK